MADVFSETLQDLMARCPGISGAAFTDFDGEEIALQPAQQREQLRTSAVYGGIALRRISDAEEKAGRSAPASVIIKGDEGALVSLKVADAYQLVLTVNSATPPALAIDSARSAVQIIEENI
ncbi:MAG: hypothetical protein ACE366_27385 [Bradymonadia bacterium]